FPPLLVLLLLVAVRATAGPAEFRVKPNGFHPYKRFKFRVKWDGRYVPGISKVTGLQRDTEVAVVREGGSTLVRRVPGTTTFAPIVLERGVTHDPEFENWANKVYSRSPPPGPPSYRKDITIELYNEAGQKVKAWNVY